MKREVTHLHGNAINKGRKNFWAHTTGDGPCYNNYRQTCKQIHWLLNVNIAQQLEIEDDLFDMISYVIEERTPETLQQNVN